MAALRARRGARARTYRSDLRGNPDWCEHWTQVTTTDFATGVATIGRATGSKPSSPINIRLQ